MLTMSKHDRNENKVVALLTLRLKFWAHSSSSKYVLDFTKSNRDPHSMVYQPVFKLAYFLGTLLASGEFVGESAWDSSILLQSAKQKEQRGEHTQHVDKSTEKKEVSKLATNQVPSVPSLATTELLEIERNCRSGVSVLSVPHQAMQIVIMPSSLPLEFHALYSEGAAKTDFAPPGSTHSAAAKAWTALALSSNKAALTSRAMGQLYSQSLVDMQNKMKSKNLKDPGINTLPGGVPLYKEQQLIGAVGVSGKVAESGRLAELAEQLAAACATGFEAPDAIQLGTPYINVTNPLPGALQPNPSKGSGASPLPLFLANFLLG